eukprot:3759046-Ditylum_brightwellii.AAC.1
MGYNTTEEWSPSEPDESTNKTPVLVIAVAKVNNRRKQQKNLAIILLLFMIVETPTPLMISRK